MRCGLATRSSYSHISDVEPVYYASVPGSQRSYSHISGVVGIDYANAVAGSRNLFKSLIWRRGFCVY